MNRIYIAIALFMSNGCLAVPDAKIYDCFLFFNELELLEIRLNELYDHVDKFVLVESKETFRGASKPLYYNENKHLFTKFADKIIHVIVDGHFQAHSAWHREAYQRNQIMVGLQDCRPNDIILISDVDEIVRSSVIPEIITTMPNASNARYPLISCRQSLYKYFVNRVDNTAISWPGTLAIFYKDLKESTPECCRILRNKTPLILYNAGWHFSYLGGHQRIVTKLAAFSHEECDTPENRDLVQLQAKIATFPIVSIDESYPAIIRNNYNKYVHMGLIDEAKPENKNALNIIFCTGPANYKKEQTIQTIGHDLHYTSFKAIIIATSDTKNLGMKFGTLEPKYLLYTSRGKQLDCLNCIILSLRFIANDTDYADDDVILFKHESVYINDMNLIQKAIQKLTDGYDMVAKYWIGFEAEKIADRLNDYYHTDSFFLKVSAARKLIKYLVEITEFTSEYQFCEEYFTKFIANQLQQVYKIEYHHSSWKDNELGLYHIPRYEEDPNWYWDKKNYNDLYK